MAGLLKSLLRFGKSTKSTIKNVATTTSALKIAGYGAVGFLAQKKLENAAEGRRNFYGDERYESKYRGGIERAAALAPYAGIGLGMASAFSYGPLGILRRTSSTAQKAILYPGYKVASKMAKTNPTAKKFTEFYGSLSKQPGITGWLGGQMLGLGGIYASGHLVANAGSIATGVAGIAGIGALKAMYKLGGASAVVGYGGSIAAGIGTAVYAGNQSVRQAAEGNITSVTPYNSSTLRKMDFNTAGLVQSLHALR